MFNINRFCGFFLLILIVAFAMNSVAVAGDWPEWRGTKRDGIAYGEKLPSPLPEKLKTVWRVKVGEGYSAPVIVGDRVYLMTRRDGNEYFISLNAKDGRELWEYHYPAPYNVKDFAASAGAGPKATVTVEKGRVFGLGIIETLTSLDAATGKVAWQHDFSKVYTPAAPETGASSSPLLWNDLCITQIGSSKDGGLRAFDAATGKEVWKTPGDGPSFTTPELFNLHDMDQVVTFTRESCIGVDPKNGDLLWSMPYKTQYEQNIVSPVAYKAMIIITGIPNPIEALRLEPEASADGKKKFKPVQVWKNDSHFSYMAAPVLSGGHLYFLSDKRKGSYVCVNADDGKTAWTSDGRYGDYASTVLVEDKLLILVDTGEIKVVPADPKGYKELATWQVAPSSTWPHLAIANSRLYVKDLDHLSCLEF